MSKKCKKLLSTGFSLLISIAFLKSLILVSPVIASSQSNELKITRIHEKHRELLDELNNFRRDYSEENSIPLKKAKEVNRDIVFYNERIRQYIEDYNNTIDQFLVSNEQKAAARRDLLGKINPLIETLKSCKDNIISINSSEAFKIFETISKHKKLTSSSDSYNVYKDNSYKKKTPDYFDILSGQYCGRFSDYPVKAGTTAIEALEEKYKKKLNDGVALTYEDLNSLQKVKNDKINEMIRSDDSRKGKLIELKAKLLDDSIDQIDNINDYLFSGEEFIDTSSNCLRMEKEDIESLCKGVEAFFDCYYDFSLDYNNLRYPSCKNDYYNEVKIVRSGFSGVEIERQIKNVQIPYVVPGNLNTAQEEHIDFLNAMSIDKATYDNNKEKVRMGGYFPRVFIKLQLDGYIEKIKDFKIKHTGQNDDTVDIDNFIGLEITQSKINQAITDAEGKETDYIILDREAILAQYSPDSRAEPVKADFIIKVEHKDGSTKEYKKTITLLPAYDEGWDIAGEDRMFIKNTLLECEGGPKQNIKEDSFIGLSELIDAKPKKGGFLASIEQDYNNGKAKKIRLVGRIATEPEQSISLTGKKEYQFDLCFGNDDSAIKASMSYKKSDNNNPIIDYPKVEIDGEAYELKYYAESSKEELHQEAKEYFKDLRTGSKSVGSIYFANEKDKDAKLIYKIFEEFGLEMPDNFYGLSGYKGLMFRNYGEFIYSDSSDQVKDLYTHAYRLFLASMKSDKYLSVEEQNEHTINAIFNIYDTNVNGQSRAVINQSNIKSEVLKLNDNALSYYDDTRYHSLAGACAPLQVKKLKMKGKVSSNEDFVPNPGDIIWMDVPDEIESDRVGTENPYILLFNDYNPDKAAVYAGYEWEDETSKHTVWHYLLTSDSYLSKVQALDLLMDCKVDRLSNGLVSIKMSDKLFWQLVSSTARTRLSFSQYSDIKMAADNSTYVPTKHNPDYYDTDSDDPQWKNFAPEGSYNTLKDISKEGVYFINTDERIYTLNIDIYSEVKPVTIVLSNSPFENCKLKLYKNEDEIARSEANKYGETISRVLLERGQYTLKITGDNDKIKSNQPALSINSLLHVSYDNREVFYEDGGLWNGIIKASWIPDNVKDKHFTRDGEVKSVLYFEKNEADILNKLRNENTLRRFRDKCEELYPYGYDGKRYKITEEALNYLKRTFGLSLGVSYAHSHPFCGMWLDEILLALPDNARLLLTLESIETDVLKKISDRDKLNNFREKCYREYQSYYPYAPKYKITEEALRYVGVRNALNHPFYNKWLHELPDLSDYYNNINIRLNYSRNGVKVTRYVDHVKGKEVINWEPWDTRIPEDNTSAEQPYCIMDETGYSGFITREWNFNSLKLQKYIPKGGCDVDEIWETVADLKEEWRYPLLQPANESPLMADFGANRIYPIGAKRKHAGVDFYGTENHQVAAMYDGEVVSVLRGEYYCKSDAVIIAHPISDSSKVLVLYGEIKLDSSIKEGTSVSKGQLLGNMKTIQNPGGSLTTMLHLEMYAEGHRQDIHNDRLTPKSRRSYPEGGYKYIEDGKKFYNFQRRDDLIDPTFCRFLPMN